ncbi:MAG: YkgJ family cysteine cluster protein [Acidobacteriota bacterium]|jgi:Fe-S-cluster containining protein
MGAAGGRGRQAGTPRDHRFLRHLDARLGEAARRAGEHVTCRLGCVECCIGPFDITPLDARRLRRGLAQLARRHPERAATLVTRARAQWEVLRRDFCGDPATGELTGDSQARLAFFTAHQALPCPALDPASGACELYAARPVSCRTFGLPIRCGEEVLPPCRLNFATASADEIAAAAVDPDPEDVEGQLLARLAGGDTVVAWVLAHVDVGKKVTTPAGRPAGSPR